MIFIISIAVLMIPCTLLFPVFKVGKKNLKKLKGQNYIISCNHTSNMDPIMLDIRFNKKHVILAKKELFKHRFFGWWLRHLGAIPVDRQHVEPQSVKQVFSALNKNKPVMIFPQGTRSTVRVEDGAAKEGVAMFSIRTGTPVVPMMFDRKIRIFHRTRLLIGEPIYPDTTRKKDKEYLDEFANLIIEKMNALLDIPDPKQVKKQQRAQKREEKRAQKQARKQSRLAAKQARQAEKQASKQAKKI